MGTELIQDSIWNIAGAHRAFGANADESRHRRGRRNHAALLVLLPWKQACRPYITISEGAYALVQRHGRDIQHSSGSWVWPSGFHSAGVGVKVSHLVTKSTIVFDTPVKGCKTLDNVDVEIDVAVMFRIMGDEARGEDSSLVQTFVHELGCRGLQTQLRDAMEEAVRRLARSVTHDCVYQLRSHQVDTDGDSQGDSLFTDMMQDVLNAQFNRFGVQVTDLVITNVTLPTVFVQQMQEGTSYESLLRERVMAHRNEMQLQENEHELIKTQLEAGLEQAEAGVVGSKMATEKALQLELYQAKTAALLEEFHERVNTMEVQIVSDGELIETTIKGGTNYEISVLKAAARAEAEAKQAQLTKETAMIESASMADKAENDARARELMADAEGEGASMVRQRREHQLAMKQLDVFHALGSNPNFTVSGSVAKNLLNEMLIAQHQSQVMLAPPTPPSA